MGNFEKLSVLVIVVIIVMILVVALYTWTEDPNAGSATATAEKNEVAVAPPAPGPVNGKPTGKVTLPDVPRPLANNPSATPSKPGTGSALDVLFPRNDKDPAPTPAGGIDPGVTPPSPAPDPASLKPVEARYHVVVEGDTFAKIAKQEYPGVGQRAIDALIKANPTIDPSRMRLREKVLLPELAATPLAGAPGTPGPATVKPTTPTAELRPGSVYVVRQGDTLPGISKRAYSSAGRWQDIWIENFGAIEDPDHLHAGTRLKLPK